MTKLKRGADGSYTGTYSGKPFRVWKWERPDRDSDQAAYMRWSKYEQWQARLGTIEASGETRQEAISGMQRAYRERLDALPPEINALLQRWIREVHELIPLLKEYDENAKAELLDIRHQIDHFEESLRKEAIRFEEKLAKLRDNARPAAKKKGSKRK